jgi:hypothetical protein
MWNVFNYIPGCIKDETLHNDHEPCEGTCEYHRPLVASVNTWWEYIIHENHEEKHTETNKVISNVVSIIITSFCKYHNVMRNNIDEVYNNTCVPIVIRLPFIRNCASQGLIWEKVHHSSHHEAIKCVDHKLGHQTSDPWVPRIPVIVRQIVGWPIIVHWDSILGDPLFSIENSIKSKWLSLDRIIVWIPLNWSGSSFILLIVECNCLVYPNVGGNWDSREQNIEKRVVEVIKKRNAWEPISHIGEQDWNGKQHTLEQVQWHDVGHCLRSKVMPVPKN